MPSLEDVANDLKGLLQDVKNNTAQTNTELNTTNTELNNVLGAINTLINIDQAGFVNLSTGVAVLIDRASETVSLLDENRQQNDTIICWLNHIADVACKQLHVLEASAQLQRSMDHHLQRLESIAQLVHAREYVEILNDEANQARIERCCPPEVTEPKPCFEPCPNPKYKPYKRTDVHFDPLHDDKIG
jgi:hypothetical protein